MYYYILGALGLVALILSWRERKADRAQIERLKARLYRGNGI